MSSPAPAAAPAATTAATTAAAAPAAATASPSAAPLTAKDAPPAAAGDKKDKDKDAKEIPKKEKKQSIASSYAIVTAPAVDLSMQELREFSEMDMEQNKNKAELDRLIKTKKDKVLINALRLNNNKIDMWGSFITKLRSMAPIDITKLQWLDLSFNKFTTIEPSIAKLKGLRKLHLHANQIHDIRDVQKLTELAELADLTLHGNPIEERGRGKYRNYIIGTLPNLKSLDFTPLTERDKGLAASFCKNTSLMKSVFTEEERGKSKDPK